jgi:hypothetical protein
VLIEEGIRANPRDGLDLILDTAIDVDDAVPHLEPREVADATVLETPDEGVRSRTPSETDDEAAPPAEAAATVTDRGWTPPQVPPPAYTLRAPAERWEPKPLTEADYEAARAAAARLTAAGPEETGRIALPPNATTGTAAIDIDTAINKRRAAGQ